LLPPNLQSLARLGSAYLDGLPGSLAGGEELVSRTPNIGCQLPGAGIQTNCYFLASIRCERGPHFCAELKSISSIISSRRELPISLVEGALQCRCGGSKTAAQIAPIFLELI
jgi:hypothetical protein